MAWAQLKPREEDRLLAGHLWVYANEIARLGVGGEPGSDAQPRPEPGSVVDLYSARGQHMGRGYWNPRTQIAIRLLTRTSEPIDEGFLRRRLAQALAWRQRWYPEESAYRLVFSEGDRLPGLVVDRYGDLLVVQILTLGMERLREPLLAALRAETGARTAFERSEGASREREGLSARVGLLWGEWPGEPGLVTFQENGLTFWADVAGGQKTGYFFDQKENRRALAPLVARGRVLDAFCHTGAFAVHAAAYGAREVLGLEISSEALALAQRNAAANGVAARCRFVQGNAFDVLRELERAGEQFDCVILDPPAFTKSKAAVTAARRGYKEINLRGIKVTRPGGFLVTCSCSYHMDPSTFYQVVLEAAVDARQQLRLVDTRTQARDHPILAGLPETQYLKCLIFQVLGE